MSKELMRENIEKARKWAEERKDSVKRGKMRQNYHFMPQTGWMNDPNGLIYFKGKYHFFYQHHPYEGFWGYMHWGHAVSEDLIHWEYLPPALAPSESYDNHPRGGCFSGSAIEYDDKLFLVYTGAGNTGKGVEQTQCVAYSEDGIHFKKYEGNPVLRAPAGVPNDFFRDPKVWQHEGSFYMVCGAQKEGMGQALLYQSEDMFHWEFVNVLAESRGEWGYMWECPDFFPLEDKYVLMFSPMGVEKRTSVYLAGDFDYRTGKFYADVSGEIDWGMDYYAPQSFLSPEGRRIVTAWANEWEWMPFWKDWGPTYQEGWCGFFNLPREINFCEDGKLAFRPIRELEYLREDKNCEREAEIKEGEEKFLKEGNVFEIKFKIDLKKTTAQKMHLRLRVSEGKETIVTFDLKKGEILFDRNRGDGWSHGMVKSPLKLVHKSELDVHIYSDKISVELFSDKYRNNISCNVYHTAEGQKNYMSAEGGCVVVKDLESWDLKKVCE